MMLKAAEYARLYAEFRWEVPLHLNLAQQCCDQFAKAEPRRAAILEVGADGGVEVLTYAGLREASLRLASALAQRGFKAGDRVAIMLPQGKMVPIAHMAVYRLAGIAVPIAAVFGPDSLSYRLRDSGASILITDAAGLAKLASVHEPLPALATVISTDGVDAGVLSFDAMIASGSTAFETVRTMADTPALMIYTSGTTGQPKGALHGHRVLTGHFPGVQMPHEFMPLPGDRLWTPADWAWAGGLLNVVLPGLAFGVPIVARRFDKFDPEDAFALMAAQKVRNIFVPPTALRMLRTVSNPCNRHRLVLRTVASGGEALGEETLAWGQEALGLTINEFYGQTECNLVLSSCAAIGVSRPGAIGKAVPGHRVAIIRPDGSVCDADEEGQIAIARPDPVMFLEYWGKPEATRAKFIGQWMTTGDQGSMDHDGYVRFKGRDDDVITSAGYRIGPAEIEDCLIGHPAVALAAVVGKPDPLRTEIVKAFVVLREGSDASPQTVASIQDYVRTRLSAHEYPREIAFIEEMPMTTTGKIIRRLLREQG